MEDGGVVLMDLLWSDPTTNDGVEGVQPSPRGPGLVTFGPDRVREFCRVRFELFEHFRIRNANHLGHRWCYGLFLHSAFN